MKWISCRLFLWSLSVLFSLSFFKPAKASWGTYHLANPFGWAHSMPTGETPGWSKKNWINFEFNQANLWNSEDLVIRNRRNGQIITFMADYEQSSAILEAGHAFSDRFAASILIPYAYRGGGILDSFIDDFHVMAGTHRYARQFFRDNRANYRITTDGQTRLEQSAGGDLGSIKFKFKYWLLQLESSPKGSCNCGFAFALHAKAPIGQPENGFSSGEWDYTGALHLGIPLWRDSGFYATSALTYISPNRITKDWPMRTWQQMYEATFDLGIGSGWGIVFTGRMESPWLNIGDVEFETTSENSKVIAAERAPTGWNGLVYWRGSQSAGVRYRDSSYDVGVHVIEDWALGNYDEDSDKLYVNNAPDVGFVFKFNTSF